jgi:flagellar hook-associated protein 3 FlgL
MLPTIDPSGQQFLNSLARTQSRLDDAQQQISSGRRLNQPSDAPDQVSAVLQLHADIKMNQAVQKNLQQVKSEVDVGEQTLSSSIDLLQQASVYATEAEGPQQDAQTRAMLAGNVETLLERMVNNSRTTLNGRYIFSGDADQSPAYQLDLTSATGVQTLQISSATRTVAGPGGSTFPVALTANDVFDARNPDGSPASNNVFAALNSLRVALTSNDDAGIKSAISSLDLASKHMNDQLAFYGQTQSRIAAGLNDAQNNDVRLQTELSKRQDADMTQEITELQQAQTQMQAALEMRARLPRTTLFDLLSSQ